MHLGMELGSPATYTLKTFSKPLVGLLPVLAPLLCPSPLRENIFLIFLNGPERGLFIPTDYLWQWPLQGKCKNYHHGQCRTLLPSTDKSRAKLSPITEGFKSLRKKPNIYFQVTRVVSIFHTFETPFLFSFLIWKGSHLALMWQTLSKEQVSQLTDLSTCQTWE